MLKSIEEIFRMVFENEELNIDRSTCADDIEEWDSMHHIVLLSMVEEKFGVAFDIEEIISMKCVGDMMEAIERKGA